MLELFVFPQIEDTECEEETAIVFQQDRALPHFTHKVQHALNARFPDRRI
jgi:hypothetical protein